MGITRYHVSIDNGDEYVSRSQYGKYVRYDDAMAMVTALTSQLESVVAENAALKLKGREMLSEAAVVYKKHNELIHEPWGAMVDCQTLHEFQEVIESETPATDAFLAEVRASAVEMFAASLKVVGPHEHPYSVVANEFASQLRQGGSV